MELIIFDTEYTTWEGAQDRRWLGKNEYKEIIQISAIKVDWPSADILDKLVLTIKPAINAVLSDYCKSLTNITQDEVDKGVRFQVALSDFLCFCGGCLTISYGNDVGIIGENIVLTKTDPLNFYSKQSPCFLNIQYWLSLSSNSSLSLNSGKLWEVFGGKRHNDFLHEHNSLSDCLSILQSLKHLQQKGYVLPF